MAESKKYKPSEKKHKPLNDAYTMFDKFYQDYIHQVGTETFDKTCDAIQLTIDHIREALQFSYGALTHAEMGEFEEKVIGRVPVIYQRAYYQEMPL